MLIPTPEHDDFVQAWKDLSLDLDGLLEGLGLLGGLVLGLLAHDTTTPVSLGVLVLVHVALLDGLDELGELRLVLGADLGDRGDGGSLKYM